MRKFEIGKTYTLRSAVDHEYTCDYIVTKRTAQTVTITDGRETKTCRIIKQLSEMSGCETIFPDGRFSMAPAIFA